MNPAYAMGTFIRVWRQEWAGLSRAQVAVAVSGASAGAKRVTKDVVYAWEGGQPPRTWAELSGLMQVMQRHGLHQTELEEFRRAAVAACSARQYPELYAEAELASRADVDEFAAAVYLRRFRPWERGSVVDLVAMIDGLRAATLDVDGVSGDGAQLRRQQVALCHLAGALAQHHAFHRRRRLHAAAAESCASLLGRFLGVGGLGGELTVLRQRAIRAHTLAHIPGEQARGWARRSAEICREATERGRRAEAALIYCDVVDAVGELEAGSYPTLLAGAAEHLDALPDPSVLCCALGWAATAQALGPQAEAQLARREAIDPCPYHPKEVSRARGWLALGLGQHKEAREHFLRAISLTESVGYRTEHLQEYVRLCDRAQIIGRALPYREYRLGRAEALLAP